MGLDIQHVVSHLAPAQVISTKQTQQKIMKLKSYFTNRNNNNYLFKMPKTVTIIYMVNADAYSAWAFVIQCPVAISSASRATAGSNIRLAAATTTSSLLIQENGNLA